MPKMGFFDLFGNRPSFQEGLEKCRATPNAVLLDVRTREEYASGHVPGSVNLPLDQISQIEKTGAGKESPLFVYCHSGARSGSACAWLSRQGYQAENLGGITAYRGPLE